MSMTFRLKLIPSQDYSPVIIGMLLFVYFQILCFRAFGDKTNPPSLPDVEGDGEEVEEEEREVNEGGEQAQEPCPDTERTTEQARSVIEELSLTELEEDTIGKSQNPEEEDEAEQESPKMTQGRQLYAFIPHHFLNTYCHGEIRKNLFIDLNRNHLYLLHILSYRGTDVLHLPAHGFDSSGQPERFLLQSKGSVSCARRICDLYFVVILQRIWTPCCCSVFFMLSRPR